MKDRREPSGSAEFAATGRGERRLFVNFNRMLEGARAPGTTSSGASYEAPERPPRRASLATSKGPKLNRLLTTRRNSRPKTIPAQREVVGHHENTVGVLHALAYPT